VNAVAGGHFSAPISAGGARFGFDSLFVTVSGRRLAFEGTQKPGRDAGNLIDRTPERIFVGLRWLMKAADLPYELERGGSNFFLGDGRIEIEEGLDTPAHAV
jgi:hypothetical protein